MKSFRSKVFLRAHQIKSATNKSFAICLAKAWTLYRMIRKMQQKVVEFAYEKKDGSLRKAQGTLQNVGMLIKGTGTNSAKVVRYWDIEANAFRCFRVENLITIY